MDASDHQIIRRLFDDYLRMYSSRDDRLTEHFSDDFSGFTGGGDFLVKNREEWVAITRQDFAQVKQAIRIELKDLAIQSLAETIAVTTGFFNIHLPFEDHILSRETARLVLIFRKESAGWKISHSSISIPYHLVREGEVYPLKELVERNRFLEEQVTERTGQLSTANAELQRANAELADKIAEQKRAEAEKEQLEAQNRQLQKSESLGRMAGAIAHRFNNQLQAVMMSLELARNDLTQAGGPVANLAEAMHSARKAAEVSGSMLTYLGQTHCQFEPLDLSDACRQTLSLLRAAVPQSLVLQTDLPSPGPVISANANQLQQILTNLLTNAAEACVDGQGIIRLAVRSVPAASIPAARRFPIDYHSKAGEYACLEVADTGAGIEAKDLEKIFDPFFSTKFVGRGMGLAVVLGIVREHAGAITVESEPGRGSVFRLFLPVLSDPVFRPPAPATQASRTVGGMTVLVVDDERAVRNSVTLALRQSGFTVLAAEDGAKAVEVFERQPDEIGCVLCDLTMPGMNGWETLTALRRISPGIPVILSSGYSAAQAMAGDHPELPQAFLSKPYRFEALRETIARVTGRQTSSR